MSGISVTVYYDQKKQYLIDGTNVASAATTSVVTPSVFAGDEHAIVRAYLYEDASTSTKSNCSGLTFTAKIGDVGETALMSASNSAFNVNSDWSSVNVASGQICFYVNAASAELITDLSTSDLKQYTTVIIGTDSDSDDRTLARFNINVKNTVI